MKFLLFLFIYIFNIIFSELIPKIETYKNGKVKTITYLKREDNKLIKSKPLLSKKIHDQFNEALKERTNRGHFAEITFIGINSANIKEHKKIDNILEVTVDFVGEVITCIKDKDKKIISGSPDKIKKIYDTWVFSRNVKSHNPNWQLIDILT